MKGNELMGHKNHTQKSKYINELLDCFTGTYLYVRSISVVILFICQHYNAFEIVFAKQQRIKYKDKKEYAKSTIPTFLHILSLLTSDSAQKWFWTVLAGDFEHLADDFERLASDFERSVFCTCQKNE